MPDNTDSTNVAVDNPAGGGGNGNGASADFLELLKDSAFNIETSISEVEARLAARLFRIVNLILSGRTQRTENGTTLDDVLAILRLNFDWETGLANELQVLDGILREPLNTDVPAAGSLGDELERLSSELTQIQSQRELQKALREAKRNFNLGPDNSVTGNVRFPEMFNRLVDLLNDPLTTFDIRREQNSERTDREEIARAYDVLREIKGLVLQIVRSLSRYGSTSLESTVDQWEAFAGSKHPDHNVNVGALPVLASIADRRNTDEDEKNPWSVLAALTGRDRELDIAPYAVLSRRGGNLLDESINLYVRMQDEKLLDAVGDDDMLKIFQPNDTPEAKEDWFTVRVRSDAAVIRRYPLQSWQ